MRCQIGVLYMSSNRPYPPGHQDRPHPPQASAIEIDANQPVRRPQRRGFPWVLVPAGFGFIVLLLLLRHLYMAITTERLQPHPSYRVVPDDAGKTEADPVQNLPAPKRSALIGEWTYFTAVYNADRPGQGATVNLMLNADGTFWVHGTVSKNGFKQDWPASRGNWEYNNQTLHLSEEAAFVDWEDGQIVGRREKFLGVIVADQKQLVLYMADPDAQTTFRRVTADSP
jgi:hypothetical protein